MHQRAIVFMILVLGAIPASGQDWARKMFQETSHDFGVVARGAKSEYRFVLQNLYEEDVHIAGVRSSCGCATPQISKQLLKTWEKGEIIATYNTRSFLGTRGATITVTIDRPYYAEVQLHITGYIRGDVVFDPGSVNFGEVEQGQSAEVRVHVNYAGRSDWQIVDIRSANSNLEVELEDAQRRGGYITYQMLVRLLPTAQAGYVNDQLTIVTSDDSRSTIPLAVEGRVRSALTLSPDPLILGVVASGEQVQKKVLVRSKTPFRIMNVTCDGEELTFDVNTEKSATTHFIPVTFTAGKPGRIERRIRVETDLGGSIVGELVATADVKSAEVSTPANTSPGTVQ